MPRTLSLLAGAVIAVAGLDLAHSAIAIAFNLADVAVGLGFVLLLPATAVFAVQNRERLLEPI